MLKIQLDVSHQLDGMYIISPSLPKWWDGSWNYLCHSEYMDKEYGYATTKEAMENTIIQPIKNIQVKELPILKFGCGMHTLYSKSFWKFVGIPESFGGYGPEDTYGMEAGKVAIHLGYKIQQFVMDGIYITEDYINRTPSFSDKIKPIDKKKEFYDKAYNLAPQEIIALVGKLIQKNQSIPQI
jgi:hypothetical protein